MKTLPLLCAAFLLGCGGNKNETDQPRVPTVPVKGTVTRSGKKLAGIEVRFVSKSGPGASGKTNAKGEFVLFTYDADDGAAPGEYKVILIDTKAGSEELEDGGMAPLTEGSTGRQKSRVPPKYSSTDDTPLSATVSEQGPNTFTFEIKN